MNKFTACLKREKKKGEQRKWKEEEERKLEINKKEEKACLLYTSDAADDVSWV